jgi:phosphocarrier protein
MDQVQIKKLKIENDLGLHGRAAARIVDLAGHYKSKLYLNKGGNEVDGTSILSILTLACPKGTEIEARVVGEDSEEFMKRLSDLFKEKFGESK